MLEDEKCENFSLRRLVKLCSDRVAETRSFIAGTFSAMEAVLTDEQKQQIPGWRSVLPTVNQLVHNPGTADYLITTAHYFKNLLDLHHFVILSFHLPFKVCMNWRVCC